MHFNVHGNLEGGIIEVENLSEVEEFLVTNFPTSITRRRNFDSLKSFLEELDSSKVKRIWLDGSFCSNKVDPNDIDCVIFVDPLHQDYIDNLRTQHGILKNHYLDVYPVPDKELILFHIEGATQAYHNADYQEKYWLGQFGFDRSRQHKAIVELRLGGEY